MPPKLFNQTAFSPSHPSIRRYAKSSSLHVFNRVSSFKLALSHHSTSHTTDLQSQFLANSFYTRSDKQDDPAWTSGMCFCVSVLLIFILQPIEGTRTSSEPNVTASRVVLCDSVTTFEGEYMRTCSLATRGALF